MNLFFRLAVFFFLPIQLLCARPFGPPAPDARILTDPPPIDQPDSNLSPTSPLISFFQTFISPQDGAVCRLRPTCSRYGHQALQRHNLFKAVLMTADRLLRDHPFTEGGVDLVD